MGAWKLQLLSPSSSSTSTLLSWWRQTSFGCHNLARSRHYCHENEQSSRIRYDTNTIKVRASELNKNRVNNIYPRWIICVWLDEDRCLIRWTRFPNSNVAGGIVILARDLRDCQDACANSPNCTGVDWNATAPAGRRCWMIGPWSAPQMNNGTAKGVDHYRIERPTDCDGKKVIFHCSTRIKVTV